MYPSQIVSCNARHLSGCTARALAKLTRLAIAFLSLMLWRPAPAMAHNPAVHARIVRDAIQYIKEHGTWVQRQALDRLIAVTGGRVLLVDALANAAYATDFFEDLYYYANARAIVTAGGLLWDVEQSFAVYDDDYLTRLQHFVNVDRVPDVWAAAEGYYYQHSSKQGLDRKAFSSWRVLWGDVEVHNAASLALSRYQAFWKGSLDAWNRNWTYQYSGVGGDDDWDIENTKFAPVTAMASYWFTRFLAFPEVPARVNLPRLDVSGGGFRVVPTERIRGAELLGPVLHAVADGSVFHHAIGTIDLGHTDYEDDFEELYLNRRAVVPQPTAIAAHLRQLPFLQRGTSPTTDLVQTLQAMVVTADVDGAGTDAAVRLELGDGQVYGLNTDMDDFERGNDDVFTLKVKPGTRVSDFTRLRIRRNDEGGPWRLQGVYLLVNGVRLYGKGSIGQVLSGNAEWSAPDFAPMQTLGSARWPIDEVIVDEARYVSDYFDSRLGHDKVRSLSYWNTEYYPGALTTEMQHLLNLAIATTVRVIEMSQPQSSRPVSSLHVPSKPLLTARLTASGRRVPGSRPRTAVPGFQSAGADSLPNVLPSHLALRIPVASRAAAMPALQSVATLSSQVASPDIVARLDAAEDSLAKALERNLPAARPNLRQHEREPKTLQSFTDSPAPGPTFRPPTQSEVLNAALGRAYHRQRVQQRSRAELADIEIARAMTKARLARTADSAARRKLELRLRSLAEVRTRLMNR